MFSFRQTLLFYAILLCFQAYLNAEPSAIPQPSATPMPSNPFTRARDHIRDTNPGAISGNPAAVNSKAGTGALGNFIGIPKDSGIEIGGLWLGDYNILMSGGAQPGASSWNSVLIASLHIDTEKLFGWKGGSFGIQFLQLNAQGTNKQAGSVQGYNSLPGAPPLERSELYQLWVRQSFFDDHLIIRVGKSVPNYDFGNVARPVPSQDEHLAIPSVSGLLFTPIFVNPTLLGSLPGYYNSACGLTVTIAPTKNTYLNYGFYDGNMANGAQTGMLGPQFDGYYFNIWEAGVTWNIAHDYPGQFSAGLWYQTGVLQNTKGMTQDGTGGFYFFGSQRIWKRYDPPASIGGGDGKGKTVVVPTQKDHISSISFYYQYGINNSTTLPVNQYFGGGLTAFGMIPGRPGDSVGTGLAWSWLDPNKFSRPSELMFQWYYQAHLVGATFLEPAITYIPTPGASPSLSGAWALTVRVTVLF
ncbi:MAG: carbohydrate porin [Chthoniobacterales bacterium]